MATKKKNAPKASEKRADDPCWNGYEKIGMKTKNGKKVPNCVPEKESATSSAATPKVGDSDALDPNRTSTLL